MGKFRTYDYRVVNPEKFTNGGDFLVVKSSWELEFAKTCDLVPTVLSWGYETTEIPYRDPLTGKQKIYIPDFFVQVARKGGHSQHYVFEIKPMHEQLDGHARNSTDAAIIARNNAKWMAATMWADRHSAEFVVLNEDNLFAFHDTRKPRMHPVKTYAATHATKTLADPKRLRNRGKTQNTKSRSGSRRSKTSNKVAKARKAIRARARKA